MTLNEQAPAAVAQKAQTAGGHWYSHDDARGWFPLYEPGKNYTLRDARKLKETGAVVVPSVTTYFNVLHKQMLVDWLIGQHLDVALKTARSEFANDEQWKEHVSSIADNSSKGAMDLGTRIHTAYELAVGGGDYEAELDVYVQPALREREKLGLKMIAQEICLGSLKYGYGGRTDELCDGMTVVDVKSRKSRKAKVGSYSTDEMQLAAYGFAKWGNEFFRSGRGVILGLSTSEPGVITAHIFTGPELVPAFEAFLGLMQVWRFENNFDPRRT